MRVKSNTGRAGRFPKGGGATQDSAGPFSGSVDVPFLCRHMSETWPGALS